MPVIRKLVAVVAADVVGYSRLMERDEAGTHERLRKLRDELIDPKIAEHGGRIVHTSGDGMLVEFPSATSALRCAVEVQRELGARNLYVTADEKIELRIGINLGDIIVEGDDIIGDGVNVAARLETLAEPGGICVASAIWEQVHEDLGIDFVDAGEQHVKNISKPIRMFRVALGKGSAPKAGTEMPASSPRKFGGRPAAIVAGTLVLLAVIAVGIWQLSQRIGAPAATSAAGPPPRSIIVKAFGGPAGDAQLNALAGALGGDVARALANSVRDANIVAPQLATTEKDKPLDERALAREANVRYVVAGDVRVAGDDIAVNARLIDGTTGKQLASERQTIARTRATEDQDLLVARVTAAARLMFQNAEGRRIAAEPATATDAQSLVARANAIFTSEDLTSTRAARKLYEQAIARDPTLVAAWVGHMYTLDDEHWWNFAAGRDERLIAEIDRDSRRAVALDDRDPVAWSARAEALAVQSQWQAAFEASDRALALDPSRFLSRAGLYIRIGKVGRSLAADRQAQHYGGHARIGPAVLILPCACAPRSIRTGHRRLRARGRQDNFYWVYLDLVAAYAQTGDMARAEAAKAQLLKRAPDFTISRLLAKQFSSDPVWNEEIRTRFVPGWRKAGLPDDSRSASASLEWPSVSLRRKKDRGEAGHEPR